MPVEKATSRVTQFPAAQPELAAAHFAGRLAFETDCADVYDSLSKHVADFVLLDVRGNSSYQEAHVPLALNLPHAEITADRVKQWPEDTLFVVYCAGPHCNGADKGALALLRLRRSVKLMIGGMTGWADEGYPFVSGSKPGSIDSTS
ncbi:rhodanese-like domain-containing protein [uncultured Bradyrhizobium sp.]|uniref:rhodanese-like domain-containing protein n=1 Tax=uncultured Bradyrhizobium sp. TaxID=199684 RepID=UPI0035CC1FB6